MTPIFPNPSTQNPSTQTPMKRILALAVCACAALSLQAEVLVYEGFHTTEYQKEGGGLTGNVTLRPTQSVSAADGGAVGTAKGTKWTGNTGVVVILSENQALSLPSAMTTAGFSATGTSLGISDSSSVTTIKYAYHALATDVLKATAGNLCFRALVHFNSKSANNLTAAESAAAAAALSASTAGYFGFGFARQTGTMNEKFLVANPSTISFMVWKRSSDSANVVSLCAVDAEGHANFYDLGTLTWGTPHVCFAEVGVNKGAGGELDTIRAGVVSSSSYSTTLPWAQIAGSGTKVELDVFTETSFPTCMGLSGPQGSNGARVDEFCVGTQLADVLATDETADPLLGATTLTRNGDGTYTVSATVGDASGRVVVTATPAGGGTAISSDMGTFAADETKTATLSGFAADTTYAVSVALYKGNALVQTREVGTLYAGALALTWVQDANEYQRVPGEAEVSRLTAENLPLSVNFAFSAAKGSEGTTWVAPALPLVIPAGAASATIHLTPLRDDAVDEDLPVTVTLTNGNYTSGATTTVTIRNLAYPAGANCWIAAAPDKASVAANWSLGRVPVSTDVIVVDGEFDPAQADLEWDVGVNGVPAAVAGWRQTSSYTGTVTMPTAYSGNFTCFTVNGDMSVDGGAMTQQANDQTEAYRLKLDVKGAFTVGPSGTVDVSGKGPFGLPSGRVNGVYGGDIGTLGAACGSIREPSACGARGYSKCSGGGAVWIEAASAATVNGKILSDGQEVNGYVSSGGSVYLKGASVTLGASALVSATAVATGGGQSTGSGGRIAIVATDGAVSFAPDNVRAYGYACTQGARGGAGTVFVKDSSSANGTLIVRNDPNRSFTSARRACSVREGTPLPQGESMFDGVVLGNFGVLVVGPGATLRLPNGFASVTAANDSSFELRSLKARAAGLLMAGGSIDAPAVEGVHTLAGGTWTFQPSGGFAFAVGDVVVKDGANLGGIPKTSHKNDWVPCQFTVTGDLTVESSGTMVAENAGIGGDVDAQQQAYISFVKDYRFGTGHGGQNGMAEPVNNTYDSVFAPSLPGTPAGPAGSRQIGAGAIVATVSGCCTLDGRVSVDSAQNFAGGQLYRPPSPGSISLTVGSLAGTATISANGLSGNTGVSADGYGPSGGGRIAIRLTDANATFSNQDLARITACGVTQATVNSCTNTSSAGTVYLETAAQSGRRGLVIVRNDNNTANMAYTPIPAAAEADSAEDFSKASLSVEAAARVKLFADLKMNRLGMADGTILDLNGHVITVTRAQIGNAKFSNGTYTAAQLQVLDVNEVVDTADGAGGSLVISGDSTVLLFR